MIVGFTIIDLKGQEDAARAFIRKVCVLENPDVADNIVKAGVGVNVYAKGLTKDELKSLPFSVTPIYTRRDAFLVASVVDFKVEFKAGDKVVELLPTGYIYVSAKEIGYCEQLVRQGLLTTFPELTEENKKWILEAHIAKYYKVAVIKNSEAVVTGDGKYAEGEQVTLECSTVASDDGTGQFLSWRDENTGTLKYENPLKFIINEDRTYRVVVKRKVIVTVNYMGLAIGDNGEVTYECFNGYNSFPRTHQFNYMYVFGYSYIENPEIPLQMDTAGIDVFYQDALSEIGIYIGPEFSEDSIHVNCVFYNNETQFCIVPTYIYGTTIKKARLLPAGVYASGSEVIVRGESVASDGYPPILTLVAFTDTLPDTLAVMEKDSVEITRELTGNNNDVIRVLGTFIEDVKALIYPVVEGNGNVDIVQVDSDGCQYPLEDKSFGIYDSDYQYNNIECCGVLGNGNIVIVAEPSEGYSIGKIEVKDKNGLVCSTDTQKTLSFGYENGNSYLLYVEFRDDSVNLEI